MLPTTLTAALFTRICTGPTSSVTSRDRGVDLVAVAGVHGDAEHRGRRELLRQPGRDLVGATFVDVGDDDPRTARREPACRCLSDAGAGGAGDQRDTSVELVHVTSRRRGSFSRLSRMM